MINNVSLLEITNKRKIQVKRFKQGPIDLLWDCIEICEKVDSEKERLFLWEIQNYSIFYQLII